MLLRKVTFANLFIVIGLLVQVVTYFVSNGSLLSLISGCAGVFSVVLCSEKKISMYTFGFIQLITYVVLCLQQNLYGEIGENIFYFLTMVVGIILWKRNYNKDEDAVNSKKLEYNKLILLIVLILSVSLCLGRILSIGNDPQPYLDAFSTVPAVCAQLLMIFRYKEQWIFWLIVDILTCILWFRVGDWCMVAQYLFWIVNCIYGLKKWSE